MNTIVRISLIWFRYGFSKGKRRCNDIKVHFFPKFKIVQIILGGGEFKKIMDFFHNLWHFFWMAPLSLVCCHNWIFNSPRKFFTLVRHVKLAILNDRWHVKLAIQNNEWHMKMAMTSFDLTWPNLACHDLSEPVLTSPDLSWTVMTCYDLSWPILTCPDLPWPTLRFLALVTGFVPRWRRLVTRFVPRWHRLVTRFVPGDAVWWQGLFRVTPFGDKVLS